MNYLTINVNWSNLKIAKYVVELRFRQDVSFNIIEL
jgi:hypothetical protein